MTSTVVVACRRPSATAAIRPRQGSRYVCSHPWSRRARWCRQLSPSAPADRLQLGEQLLGLGLHDESRGHKPRRVCPPGALPSRPSHPPPLTRGGPTNGVRSHGFGVVSQPSLELRDRDQLARAEATSPFRTNSLSGSMCSFQASHNTESSAASFTLRLHSGPPGRSRPSRDSGFSALGDTCRPSGGRRDADQLNPVPAGDGQTCAHYLDQNLSAVRPADPHQLI